MTPYLQGFLLGVMFTLTAVAVAVYCTGRRV